MEVILAVIKPKKQVTTYIDGNIHTEEWVLSNIKYTTSHREDGPARITYFRNGTVEIKRWLRYGEYVRLDGPCYEHFFENGKVNNQEWHYRFNDFRFYTYIETDINGECIKETASFYHQFKNEHLIEFLFSNNLFGVPQNEWSEEQIFLLTMTF